jgi:hypothetical protein
MNYLSKKVKMICSLEQGEYLIPLGWSHWVRYAERDGVLQ